MQCPECNCEELSTTDSRDYRNNQTRRRKECNKCGYRFSTLETIFDFKKRSQFIRKYNKKKMPEYSNKDIDEMLDDIFK